MSKFNSLPKIIAGSDKQIAWAEKIRAEKVETLLVMASKVKAEAQPTWNAIEGYLVGQNQALWWIAHKDYTPEHIAKNAMLEIMKARK